ncbi:hypothetical protein pdam_00025390, partial [Pocillopora damicornis]
LIRTGTLHVNIALHDIIGNFDVKCNKSSCLWTGKFHKHEQHLKTCGKFQMPCANDGCREVVTRERMAAHTVQCTKHKLPCQQCGRKITRESFKEHTASLCSNKRVLCPLSCGTSLPQLHLTLHLSECPERALHCAVTGCIAITKQKKVPQHSTNRAATHSVLQEGEIQRLRDLMHFQRTKPRWILEGRVVFSFHWRGEKWSKVKGPHLFSNEYRCPNGNSWRAHLQFAGLSLELVSIVMAVEKVFPFLAKEIREGEVAANTPLCERDHMDPENIMIVKFVLTYYLLKEDKKGNEVANDNAENGNRLCTKTEVNAISTGQTDMKF